MEFKDYKLVCVLISALFIYKKIERFLFKEKEIVDI